MLYYLIYASKATTSMNAKELLSLLDESRTWNESNAVTGMLLYIHASTSAQQAGRFIQVLEGSEQDVITLLDKIKKDNRHQQVVLLNKGPLRHRNFEDWKMGFEMATNHDLINYPGYVELNDDLLKSPVSNKFNFALNFLKSFYELRSKIC